MLSEHPLSACVRFFGIVKCDSNRVLKFFDDGGRVKKFTSLVLLTIKRLKSIYNFNYFTII